MQRYFLKLSYCGTNYHGWQIQDNAHSVQAEIQNALALCLGLKTEITGCGRTDTGVHACEYYAHFDSKEIKDENYFLFKINKILPHDIACHGLYPVKDAAHARFSALSRSYTYYIKQNKDPFWYQRAYSLYGTLDIEPMKKACDILYDYSDFSCFSKSKTQVKTNNCKIINASWEQKNNLLIFSITADRFLRNMVRAIVGTMINLGQEKIKPEEIRNIIESRNRSYAGMSVPACGLYLTQINYPEDIYL